MQLGGGRDPAATATFRWDLFLSMDVCVEVFLCHVLPGTTMLSSEHISQDKSCRAKTDAGAEKVPCKRERCLHVCFFFKAQHGTPLNSAMGGCRTMLNIISRTVWLW